jgi:hypothetical protein
MDRLRDYFARTFDAEFHSELPEKPLTQLVSRVMDNDPNDVVFRPMPISKMQAKLDDMLPMIKQEFSSDEVSMILKMLDTQSTGNVSFADIVNAIRVSLPPERHIVRHTYIQIHTHICIHPHAITLRIHALSCLCFNFYIAETSNYCVVFSRFL